MKCATLIYCNDLRNERHIIITTSKFSFSKEEQRKKQRKVARNEKKQKTVMDDGDIDPDLAATMGFAGFGTSKK